MTILSVEEGKLTKTPRKIKGTVLITRVVTVVNIRKGTIGIAGKGTVTNRDKDHIFHQFRIIVLLQEFQEKS